MSEQLRELGRKVTDWLNSDNAQVRRKWQAIIGVTFMVVFVVASVAVNQTVLALNQAAGNYGYVSGTYGYNATATSSDAVPSAPTGLSATVSSSTSTLSWTAPTTTTRSTSLNNLSSYKVHYSTSSLSSCSGGTSTTSSSASASLTGLTASTSYYVAVCATDGNSNDSSALTGSFTTAQGGGGGGGGSGGSVFGTVVSDAATTVVPGTPAAVAVQAVLASILPPRSAALVAAALGIAAPSEAALAQAASLVSKVIPATVLAGLAAATQESLKAFVAVGPEGVTASHAVVKIGAGERASLLEAFQHSQGGTLPTTARHYQFLTAHIVDPTSLAAGEAASDVTKLFPDMRNTTIESDGLKDFTNCNKRPPSVDFDGKTKLSKAQGDKEWAFVKYTGYQLKVDPAKRSLGAEAAAIKKFKAAQLTIYKNGVKVVKPAGKNPSDLFDWNFVRAATYSGAPTSCLK